MQLLRTLLVYALPWHVFRVPGAGARAGTSAAQDSLQKGEGLCLQA